MLTCICACSAVQVWVYRNVETREAVVSFRGTEQVSLFVCVVGVRRACHPGKLLVCMYVRVCISGPCSLSKC